MPLTDFQCNDCEHAFALDIDAAVPPEEMEHVCPNCGSDQIEPVPRGDEVVTSSKIGQA